jgi:hypothetical protein
MEQHFVLFYYKPTEGSSEKTTKFFGANIERGKVSNFHNKRLVDMVRFGSLP